MRKNDLREDIMQEDILRKDNKTHEEKKSNALAKELEEKLDWYITEASEEEYDEKAVEYILYLLDGMEPSEEEPPGVDDAWNRFEELVAHRQTKSPESHPLNADRMRNIVSVHGALKKEKGCIGEKAGGRKTSGMQKKLARTAGFLLRHKMAAAVILVFLVAALGGTVQTIARRDTGFFQWLKQDDTGKRMITSPESLDGETDVGKTVYFEEDDLPEWAQEWILMIDKLDVPSHYKWNRFETNIIDGLQYISSYYLNEEIGGDFALGMKLYLGKVSYNSGMFDGYEYEDCYDENNKTMEIYSKTEESGIIYYIIYFVENNRQYFVLGEQNIDETKTMASLYWNCVKNNL